MLQNVSWLEYVKMMILLLSLYYGYMLVRFYPHELARAWAWTRKSRKQEEEEDQEREAEEGTKETEETEGTKRAEKTEGMEETEAMAPVDRSLLVIAQELSGQIRALVEEAAAEKRSREELIYAFQLMLDKEPYQRLKDSPFKAEINKLIVFDVENICSIRLDAEELNALWLR